MAPDHYPCARLTFGDCQQHLLAPLGSCVPARLFSIPVRTARESWSVIARQFLEKPEPS